MIAVNNIVNFFEVIKSRVNSKEFKNAYRMVEENFTRERKISFSKIVEIILSKPQKTLTTELDVYMEKFSKEGETVTVQAFSKARQNISVEGFYDLFLESATFFDAHSQDETWNGHKVFAIDGTSLRLPNTKENIERFKTLKNQSKEIPMAKASVLYDVLNNNIADAIIDKCRMSEKDQAIKLFESKILSKNRLKPNIILFDRGYPSQEMFDRLNQKNHFFVMRCSKSFLKCVRNCNQGDSIISTNYKGTKLKLRVIKFNLSSGEEETLVTNIFDEIYGIADFKKLYFLRWGIESKYAELKISLKIENFSGKKPIAILQDFFATLLFSNIVSAFKKISDSEIIKQECHENSKYKYQTNCRNLIGIIARKILQLLHSNHKNVFINIITLAMKKRSCIRPDRKHKRNARAHKGDIYCHTLKASI